MPTLEEQHDQHKGGYAVGCLKCDILVLKKFHSLEVDQLGYENVALRAAIEVARTKGEHYPVCGMPPREVMNDQMAHREWIGAKYAAWATPEGKKAWWAKHCTCWKAEMEAACA